MQKQQSKFFPEPTKKFYWFARSNIPPLFSCWWAVVRTTPLSILWDLNHLRKRRKVLRQQLWVIHHTCEALGLLSSAPGSHTVWFWIYWNSSFQKSSPSPSITPTMLSEWGRAVIAISISFFSQLQTWEKVQILCFCMQHCGLHILREFAHLTGIITPQFA